MVKRAEIKKFIPVTQPLERPVTKFGGQPNWIESPEWPISQEYNCPMQFVCQIQIPEELFPGCGGKMAYLFLTSDDVAGAGMAETWNPWSGENAVIIQPGGENTPKVESLATGPTVQSSIGSPRTDVAVEYAVELVVSEEPSLEIEDDFYMMEEAEIDEIYGLWSCNKIGGVPSVRQANYDFLEDNWVLLLQIFDEGVPFWINFGDGIGHLLIDKSGKTGIFRWER